MRGLKFLLVPFVVAALAGAAVCADLTIVYNDGLIRGPQCQLRADKPSFVRSNGDIVAFADCNGATIAPPGLALTVTPGTLPAGKVGVTYNQTVTLKAAEGSPPYKFTCTSLVGGIASPQAVAGSSDAESTCTFSGTPAAQSPTDKPFDLFFTVEDSSVPIKSDVQRLTVAVEPAPVPACQLTNWQNCTTCFSAWAPDPCGTGTTQTRSAVGTPLGCIAQPTDPPQSLLSRTCGALPACTDTDWQNCTNCFTAWSTCNGGTQTRAIQSTPSGCDWQAGASNGVPSPGLQQRTCNTGTPSQGIVLPFNLQQKGSLGPNAEALYKFTLDTPCSTGYRQIRTVVSHAQQSTYNIDMLVKKSWAGVEPPISKAAWNNNNRVLPPPTKADYANQYDKYVVKQAKSSGADGEFFASFNTASSDAVSIQQNYTTLPGFSQADTYYILLVNRTNVTTAYSLAWYCQ